MKPCLFLDRDGVINHDDGYAWNPSDIRFIDGIFDMTRQFAERGFLICIVTNQSGVARGYYTEDEVRKLMTWMEGEFARRHVRITGSYWCPHLEEITGPCECRKPQPGMLLKAMDDYPIDPARSLIVGDRERDMEAGRNAGLAKQMLYNNAEHPDISKAYDWQSVINELLGR